MKSGIMPTPPKTSGRVNYFCSQLGSVSRGGLLIYFIVKFKVDIIAYVSYFGYVLYFGAIMQYCEAQARVRQGSARDGPQGERPQSLNPCLELTLKLVATTHHHPPPKV